MEIFGDLYGHHLDSGVSMKHQILPKLWSVEYLQNGLKSTIYKIPFYFEFGLLWLLLRIWTTLNHWYIVFYVRAQFSGKFSTLRPAIWLDIFYHSNYGLVWNSDPDFFSILVTHSASYKDLWNQQIQWKHFIICNLGYGAIIKLLAFLFF